MTDLNKVPFSETLVGIRLTHSYWDRSDGSTPHFSGWRQRYYQPFFRFTGGEETRTIV